ncbi:ISAs1 family transposase [Pleurocapsales cyanobacterium LEGE 06147]|nr:ISAs1 family transposase [Pleurocapsales cyanobacterium LEGE 06147]
MPSIHKKTIQTIIDGGNHDLAAVNGNQSLLYQTIKQKFIVQETFEEVNKGHGRREKRQVSISQTSLNLSNWPGLTTIIKGESERKTKHQTEYSTRYYISDLNETAFQFYQRIRGYWGVENKVHYVRDVTQGEDKSRIRTTPLPQLLALARNLAINLYRDAGFKNMAQAQRKCGFGLEQILTLFRMKYPCTRGGKKPNQVFVVRSAPDFHAFGSCPQTPVTVEADHIW